MDSSLRELAEQQDFYIGTTLDDNVYEKDPQHAETLVREFNMVATENALKFHNVQIARDEFDFSGADQVVDFAVDNNLAIRGHTLVWEHNLPDWLTQGSWSREDVIDILETHIKTVVGRYRGTIDAWDVVNEAIGGDDQLRESFWYRNIGPDYIDMAFRWAREADPDALLFYNDYGAEGTNSKSDAVYELVNSLQQKGVPIDGVGLQMHLTLGTGLSPQSVAQNMERLGELGLRVHVTEMDVRIREPVSDEDLILQAETYQEMMDVCIAADNCDTVVIWGVSDRYSWVPYQFDDYGDALLFDDNFQPKPAYDGVSQALEDNLREAESTIVTILADKIDPLDGETSLREAIAAADNGDTITFESSLAEGDIQLQESLELERDITIDGEDRNILVTGDRFDLIKVKEANLTFKGIRLQGGNDGIELRRSNAQLTLINVEITDSRDDNLDIQNAAQVTVTMLDTLLANAQDEGIAVRGSDDFNLSLSQGSTIQNAKSDGIEIQDSKRAEIELNDATVTNNGSSGLDIDSQEADILIYGGLIQNNGSQNIQVKDARSADVSIYGTDGDDVMEGSNVGDVMGGGEGADTLTGGAGRDIFAFAPNGGRDVITDFEVGIDRIDVVELGIQDRSGIGIEGDSVVFNVLGGGRVALEGVDAAQLSDSDFVWG
ncbi:MAG: endo-1,4-beta-xylanase [Phormidesmis sp.]